MEIVLRAKCPDWLVRAARGAAPVLAIVVAGIALGGPPWMSGDTLKAADLNTLDTRISSLESSAASKTNVEAALAASFPATQGQFIHVPYATASIDSLSEWNASTGTFKAKFDGTYEICASLSTQDKTITYELDTYINGSRKRAFAMSQVQPNNGNFIAGCAVENLTAGQTLDVRTYQNVAASVQIASAADWNTIQIVRL